MEKASQKKSKDLSVKNVLVILGNGADLACGLASNYYDFFQWQFKKILESQGCDSTEKNIFECAKKYYTQNASALVKSAITGFQNFWTVLFLAQNSKANVEKYDWCNIESIIKETVTECVYYDDLICGGRYLEDPSHFLIGKLVEKYKNKTDPVNSLTVFLLDKLKDFEGTFAKYIREEKNKSSIYKDKFPKMLDEISNAQLLYNESRNWNPNKEVTVLSFNYSSNISDNYINFLKFNIHKWINIHGYVGKNENDYYEKPIFGIDSTEVLENDPRIIFTKTFRVATEINNHLESLPKTIDLLAFYGHSLAEADYSYFEALFDMYDLYSSDIVLCFYYGAYLVSDKMSSEEKQECKVKNNNLCIETTTNIYNLLRHYGSSLKENHGDNLLHRLLLEGRIKIFPREGDRKLEK